MSDCFAHRPIIVREHKARQAAKLMWAMHACSQAHGLCEEVLVGSGSVLGLETSSFLSLTQQQHLRRALSGVPQLSEPEPVGCGQPHAAGAAVLQSSVMPLGPEERAPGPLMRIGSVKQSPLELSQAARVRSHLSDLEHRLKAEPNGLMQMHPVSGTDSGPGHAQVPSERASIAVASVGMQRYTRVDHAVDAQVLPRTDSIMSRLTASHQRPEVLFRGPRIKIGLDIGQVS